MIELGNLQSGDLLSSGLYPGLHGEAPPLWADGRNVTFDNISVRKSYGLLGLANLSDRPTGIKSTFADQEARAFIGAGSSAYRYRSSDGLTPIASFATPGGQYQFVPWDTWALITNTADPVQLWKNTGLAAAITAPFTRANAIVSYGLRAIAFGTSNGGNIAEWCSINNIEDWTPTLLNSAGSLPLRQLVGDAICAKPLGNSIGVYSSVMGGLFTEIGGTLSYGFRRPITGVSAVSQNSVVSLGDRHFGLTRETAFVTDLVSFQYIDEPAMRVWMKDNVDWSRMAEIYGWPDWAASVVRWVVPLAAGGSIGVGFRWDKGTWTFFDDDVVIGEESGAFSNTLLCKADRLLRTDKESANNDGQALASYLQTKPLDFGNRYKLKRVQRISLDGTWSGNVRFKMGYSESVNDAPTWVVDKPMANTIFPDDLDIEKEAVYVTIRIETTAEDAEWKLTGARIWGTWTGNV